MSDLTPLEAAEKLFAVLKFLALNTELVGKDSEAALKKAISDEHKIDAGEYRRVVHGRWKEAIDEGPYGDWVACSNCGYETNREPLYCPSCGALMDGKDDS